MALLTADDVLNKKFQSTKFREGYDQDEVDDFLDEVVATLRDLQGRNEELTGKLATAERRIAELSRGGVVADVAPAVSGAPEPAPVAQTPQTEPYAAPVAAPEPVVPASPVLGAPVESAPAAVAAVSAPESATGMLALAQRLHDDYVRSGKEESEKLLGEARGRADQIVSEAEETSKRTLGQLEQERALLERKIDELRVFERDYRTRLKSYLENLLGDLDQRGATIPARGAEAPSI